MVLQVRRVGRHVWMWSIPAASSCVPQVGFWNVVCRISESPVLTHLGWTQVLTWADSHGYASWMSRHLRINVLVAAWTAESPAGVDVAFYSVRKRKTGPFYSTKATELEVLLNLIEAIAMLPAAGDAAARPVEWNNLWRAVATPSFGLTGGGSLCSVSSPSPLAAVSSCSLMFKQQFSNLEIARRSNGTSSRPLLQKPHHYLYKVMQRPKVSLKPV